MYSTDTQKNALTILSILLLMTVIVVLLSACEKEEAGEAALEVSAESFKGEPAYGDAIIVGSIGEPSILIPMLASDIPSHDVAGLIFNGLVKYDTDLTLIGDLAESWDISEDGLVITFYLRKGVRWTDGVKFTADDVYFGYQTLIAPKTPTAYSEDFKQVTKAEVLDRYSFRVTYDKPFAPL